MSSQKGVTAKLFKVEFDMCGVGVVNYLLLVWDAKIDGFIPRGMARLKTNSDYWLGEARNVTWSEFHKAI